MCNSALHRSKAATSALLSSMRALTLSAAPKTVARSAFRSKLPSRSISLAIPALRTVARPTVAARAVGVAEAVKQQTRGMKLNASVKRRCEHCKVVRRKAGKRHRGYIYIICPANPRHKQRQGS